MKQAVAIFVGICLGQAQTSRSDVLVTCSKGLAGNGCRNAQAAARPVIEELHSSFRDWRVVIVPDERWATTCNALRLKWAPANEPGQVLCETADQDLAENVRLSLRASSHPAGCGNGAPCENAEVMVSLTNANLIPLTVLAMAESTARRIFDGIGVKLRLTYKGGQPLSMRFDYEVGKAVHPGAMG